MVGLVVELRRLVASKDNLQRAAGWLIRHEQLAALERLATSLAHFDQVQAGGAYEAFFRDEEGNSRFEANLLSFGVRRLGRDYRALRTPNDSSPVRFTALPGFERVARL